MHHTLVILRYVPMFGEVEFDPQRTYKAAPLEEQMDALATAVRAGKVRAVGLSNETTWGLAQFCHLGEPADHLAKIDLCSSLQGPEH